MLGCKARFCHNHKRREREIHNARGVKKIGTFRLKTPLKEEEIRKLRVKDIVFLSGTVFTARDEAHERALKLFAEEKKLPFKTKDLALYHCGPVVQQKGEGWKIIAAGPTTSARMNLLEPIFVEKTGVRMIIGKGGMDENTAKALKTYGSVYLAFTGGAALIAAKAIIKVNSVEWVDLGTPEAIWMLEVRDFGPLIVAIDSTGNNLYQEIYENALKKKNS